jgi:predicted GNAT superfamily acetyltransferase
VPSARALLRPEAPIHSGVMGGPAWEFAHEAARRAGVDLRPLPTLDDADRILEVMIATWGEHQLLPREMIHALGASGNVPWGAFDGEEMIGYVLGWTGVDPEEGLHTHSHMLAALPERRHRGVGFALKLAQRAQALEQGIRLIRWTFDPLVARNAYFNLWKLGAVADRFHRNFYGEMTDSLNRGERSDRFVVRWELDRTPGPRNVPADGGSLVLQRDADADAPAPVAGEVPAAGVALVQIPHEYADLRERDPELSRAWRDALAAALEACLDAGLVAASFDGPTGAYVMAEDPGS